MGTIEISGDSIYIYDADGKEIVGWVEDEWIADPSITASIANAIHMFHVEGVEVLKELLGGQI